jgi:hypothetical protein
MPWIWPKQHGKAGNGGESKQWNLSRTRGNLF